MNLPLAQERVHRLAGGLAVKLVAVAMGLLVVALAAIGMTLLQSWKLEGAAAAINDLGSQRMRSYRALLLAGDAVSNPGDAGAAGELRAEIARFDAVLALVRDGDPARPLVLPADAAVDRALSRVEGRWNAEMRPALQAIAAHPAAGAAALGRVRGEVGGFVADIDAVVRAAEAHNASATALLRALQFTLVGMAVLGAVALIALMYLLVVRPVMALREGIRRLEAEDFSARVTVESRDEFGALGRAFNAMAAHLESLYATLEARVAEKTERLDLKNRELSTLYEVTAAVSDAADLETLCRGFLSQVCAAFEARGGAVRLRQGGPGEVHVFAAEGLQRGFVAAETCEHASACHCGHAFQRDQVVVEAMAPGSARACAQAGFRGVGVFPIRHERQVLGVFNLFFAEPRQFDARESRLLMTLGQHLGAALESLRLRSMEREMAVSGERNLIARELHDSIAQSLAFLNLQAQMLDDSLANGHLAVARGEVARMREGVQACYDDVRELLVHFRLRPGEADVAGALRQSLVQFEAQTGIAVAFSESGSGMEPSPEVQVQALHVVQEALSNVRKHARARHVSLALERGPSYRFLLRDDGEGFDPARGDRSGTHVGLQIMRERAQRIGGEVAVRSRPGGGTEVELRVPVAVSHEAA